MTLEPDGRRKSQMLKGVLDLCILALLKDGPLYGYAVVDALEGRGLDLVAEGTIYPLLARMEKAGVITSYRAPSPDGPPRKYYELTTAGQEELALGIAQWTHLNDRIDELFATAQASGRESSAVRKSKRKAATDA
jgi:PadR family transcriptional regulator PadR